jgi:RNA polymerase sigma-70 factor (ECF subfamily)
MMMPSHLGRLCSFPAIEMNDFQQTYEHIVRPIEDRMIRSIWRVVRNPQDAEDAMQDALVVVLKQWDRIGRHPNPQSLVLKICIDAAYDVTRRRLRHARIAELSQGAIGQAGVSQLPTEAIVSREQYTEIVTAIHRLPRQQATAMLMRALQGQPYEEIAAVLGCTEATARKHVARSRQRLRILLAHLDPSKAEVDYEQRK